MYLKENKNVYQMEKSGKYLYLIDSFIVLFSDKFIWSTESLHKTNGKDKSKGAFYFLYVRKFTNINSIKENKSDSLRDMLKNHDNIVFMKFIRFLGLFSIFLYIWFIRLFIFLVSFIKFEALCGSVYGKLNIKLSYFKSN